MGSTVLFNTIGQLAVGLALHRTGGLPFRDRPAAPPWAGALLSPAAAQLEEADPWRDRWPHAWSGVPVAP